jgi:hypothetical protein
MRPLFAIAPLALLLALLSHSPVEVSANFASFKAMFASEDKPDVADLATKTPAVRTANLR